MVSHVRGVQPRVKQNIRARLFGGLLAQRAHLPQYVAILHIVGVAVNHEDVLKAVEVHIKKYRLPRPV